MASRASQLTEAYRKLVGSDQVAFRSLHPERRYFHSYTTEHRCRWCGLMAWEQTASLRQCQVLVCADTEPDVTFDAFPDRPYDPINMWGACTCGQSNCRYCGC